MVRPRPILRALAALAGRGTVVVTLCAPLGAGLTVGVAAPATAVASTTAPSTGTTAASAPDLSGPPLAQRSPTRRAVPPEPDTAPLAVTISTMSRATLPARGSIKIRGRVTNRSDETWTTIKLYSFLGGKLPVMTTPTELAAAMDVPYDTEVGDRLTTVGEPGLVESLAPGESARYVVKVPADEFEFTDPDDPAEGVYWFGVHALGQGGSAVRDNVADGRARTFLPYVTEDTAAIPAALVVPVEQAVLFDSDGSVADEESWEELLSPGGRLRDLLALGEAGSDAGVPLTWLVDPALLDAIARLAAGNAPRSLTPTPTAEADQSGEPDAGEPTDAGAGAESGDTTPGPDPDEPSEPEDLPETPASAAAADWLDVAAEVFAEGEVLTLPYGNVDAGASLRIKPALLDLALAQQSTFLASRGIESETVLAAPGGYVDAATAVAAPDDVAQLVSDRFFTAPAPGVAGLGGHELVITSAGAEQGSPGPAPSISGVGLRQRIVAEAAVRALPEASSSVVVESGSAGSARAGSASVSGQPLVVVLPTDWDLSGAEELFSGLDTDWITFGDLRSATSATPTVQLDASDIVTPVERVRRELEPDTFAAAQELIDAGDTLQRVLVGNTRLGARVTEQALSAVSYSVRRDQKTARTSLALSRSWLGARLESVTISASSGFTLSGDSGTLVVTLVNDLDESVTVSIAALSDPDLTIEPIEPVELGPESRTSVFLDVSTTTSRVHNVTLMVTDAGGVPLGASLEVPIRSILVSGVIWVIIGVGVGTLFIAIALRLRRRILAARRGEPVSP